MKNLWFRFFKKIRMDLGPQKLEPWVWLGSWPKEMIQVPVLEIRDGSGLSFGYNLVWNWLWTVWVANSFEPFFPKNIFFKTSSSDSRFGFKF